jgi:uncharacterized protein (DUF427 family)
MSMQPVKVGPGQESVWDYPRPPRLEPSSRLIRVLFAGQAIAETSHAYRVLETSHPPTWYIPRNDIHMEVLNASHKFSFCEWKGSASYWTALVGEQKAENVAWSYESPNPNFAPIKGHLAFYPSRSECYVDEELVIAQPGDFYGGWITRDIVGPFKGTPGTSGW